MAEALACHPLDTIKVRPFGLCNSLGSSEGSLSQKWGTNSVDRFLVSLQVRMQLSRSGKRTGVSAVLAVRSDSESQSLMSKFPN
jgi:hypothetical protein